MEVDKKALFPPVRPDHSQQLQQEISHRGILLTLMAAGTGTEVILVQVSKRKLSDRKEVVCECCEKMKGELNEVKLEPSSFREIIRVLQEEIHEIGPSTQPTENKRNEVYEDKESYTLSASKDWTTLSSSRRRKLQYTRRNLRQLPLETSNQYATLANLNNENEFPG
jgi:hypothetical protein